MKTLADFQPLKPAEEKLLDCCESGKFAVISKKRPAEKTDENEIRATFIRWLILTKEIEIDPTGIQVQGAWISGILDLENVFCEKILSLIRCCLEERFYLRRAIIKSIYLDGSFCQIGIIGDGLVCHGNLHLRNGFEGNEEVRFSGAQIEGNFSCMKAAFKSASEKKKALHCDRINVKGTVFLSNVQSVGEVRFLGAQIGGNFDCSEAVFKSTSEKEKALACDRINVKGTVFLSNVQSEGEVRFLGAQIENDFVCVEAVFQAKREKQGALNCNNMQVKGGLLLRKNCIILEGYVGLTSANVGALVDDENFWKQETLKEVQLDGFKYGHIYGITSASFRLKKMLGKMQDFEPQPYKQLAKVLRDMGHDKDADEVMISLTDNRVKLQKNETKEAKKYIFFNWLRIKRKRILCKLFPLKRIFSNSMRILSLQISHILWKLYRLTSLYGYRPMRALGIMVFVWLLCGFIYDYSAKRAVFAPTNPLIYKPKYQDQLQETNCTLDINGTSWFASADDYNTSKNNWYYATHAEYTTFQPYWYSLDIILPIVDLKMENDWSVAIPSPDGSFFKTYNYFVRSLVWIESLIGWGLSLMLAAILSGLAKNEKE